METWKENYNKNPPELNTIFNCSIERFKKGLKAHSQIN